MDYLIFVKQRKLLSLVPELTKKMIRLMWKKKNGSIVKRLIGYDRKGRTSCI